ncbi:MAG: AraC family transcriptional regulator [Polaribacter sp.]|jgi:AraC-like DNA-binding protein|uniref:helix-turn-helix domain-containing protein n=1 Tax=Polaribacter sp. TaxID=1920175 RepID=UPI002603D720|nr:AraC family transcriptional regulator [Polaribacter sp.]MBT3740852.1 helix-turn-helix transcriptional regulator [Polaribacter sp.]MBT4413186.1 helix-turn-helix transcriptional regulator [Polaribacter sp.]MDG1196024.1 AraC family transcriptional regulator [Polaribacter sp.]MDG1403807.1 AraC family transcriptional regulator [Polaribacter sp.]MDG2435531.1 AraC family transcriptional regulator [Polaribacter sp.]
MILKKPTLEKITPNFGASLLVKKHLEFLKTNTPFWHFHPEIELVYVNKGKGKRHIGNHISYFNNSQLVLIGSNLPHIGYIDRLTTNGSETLIQFLPDFLGKDFFKIPEMAAIATLFERAKKGIRFNIEIKQRIGAKIEKLIDLEGANRITSFIEILNDLATTNDYTLLNANGFAFEAIRQDSNKIEIIYNHINDNFKEHITLDEVSNLVSMTVPAFCRYFKKSTGKTFTKLVNEYRVVHATKLLAESNMSISNISFECGFNNFSHFNKLFKEFTGKSASIYRSEMKDLIQ